MSITLLVELTTTN